MGVQLKTDRILFYILKMKTLKAVVREAYARSKPGDTILLAPACASFDQFESFEHRGRVFKDLVRQLETK